MLHSKVNTFISTGAQTYDEASRLTGGGVLLALQIGAQLGSLLLAVSVVLISLQSMRVGLLPRPLGYVGIFAGALILFPIIVVPVVQMGWLLAVGYLLTGRWPSGVPPAWRTGNAEPWPSSNEMRARRAAAGQATRSRRGGRRRFPQSTARRSRPSPRRSGPARPPRSASASAAEPRRRAADGASTCGRRQLARVSRAHACRRAVTVARTPSRRCSAVL